MVQLTPVGTSASPGPRPSCVIAREALDASNLPELLELFDAEHREVGFAPEALPLKLDRAMMKTMNERGNLRIYTVRRAGILCGASSVMLHHSPLYDCLWAMVVSLYIEPPRPMRLALRLLDAVLEDLRDLECPIQAGWRLKRPEFERVLESRGFTAYECLALRLPLKESHECPI